MIALVRWFLRLLGRLDLTILELGGDATRAWVKVTGTPRPTNPAYPFLQSVEDREHLAGDEVWTFLEHYAGKRTARMEARSTVAWKQVAAEPLEADVAGALTVRYRGGWRWAGGGWIRNGDLWAPRKLSDDEIEVLNKREVTFQPAQIRRVVEALSRWKVTGPLPKPGPAPTRFDVEPDGSLRIDAEWVKRATPLDPGWALLDGAIVPVPAYGSGRLDPDAAADFAEREKIGRVLTKSSPVMIAKPEGEELAIQLAYVWGENESATETEMRGKNTIRRGDAWCRVRGLDETKAMLGNALRKVYLDPQDFRLRHDDVPEFLAYGAEWFKDWRLVQAKTPWETVRPPTKPILRVVHQETEGLGGAALHVEFDLGGERVPLAEIAPLVAQGTRWIRRGAKWIEFDRAVVRRILDGIPPGAGSPVPIDTHAPDAWPEAVVDEKVRQLRMVIDGGRPPQRWPLAVSSTAATRIYSWIEACAAIDINPVIAAPADRDFFAAVAAFLSERKKRGGRRPVLIVTGAKRIQAWMSPIVPLTFAKKFEPGADAIVAAPNSKILDGDWPVVIFDRVDQLYPTDSSKPFRAASAIRAQMRIGTVDRAALAKETKMRALLGVVYPGVEQDPLPYIAPFSHDPETGTHLITPSAGRSYGETRVRRSGTIRIGAAPDQTAYALIALNGEPDPRKAILKLQEHWRKRRATQPHVDEWMIDWIADMYFLHVGTDAGLAWLWKHVDLLPVFRELDLLFEIARPPLEAWRRLAGVRPAGEKLRAEVEEAQRKAIALVAPEPPARSFRVRRSLFPGTPLAREVLIGRARAWSSLAPLVGNILRHAENLVRAKHKAPKLRVEIDPALARRIEVGEIKLTLDTSLVDRLQKESAEVAEILAAPEEAPVEIEEAQGFWSGLDFVQRQIVTDVFRRSVKRVRELEVQLRPLGQMPLAAIDAINERAGAPLILIEGDALSIAEEFEDELAKQIEGKVETEGDPFVAMVGQLTEPEKAALAALSKNGPLPMSKLDELLRPLGVMSGVAVDSINEKACATVGDIVLVLDGTTVALEDEDADPVRRALGSCGG